MIVNTASFFADKECKRVSIAQSQPSGFVMPTLHTALPSWNLINQIRSGIITQEQYTKRYLKNFDKHAFFEELLALKEPLITLCCWEKKGNFCHRHILADIIRKHGTTYRVIMGQED